MESLEGRFLVGVGEHGIVMGIRESYESISGFSSPLPTNMRESMREFQKTARDAMAGVGPVNRPLRQTSRLASSGLSDIARISER